MKTTMMPVLLGLACLSLVGCAVAAANEPTDPGEVTLPAQKRVEAPTGETPRGEGVTTSNERFELPAWTLEDVQPKSTRFGERYGLEAFSGKTVVVVLLEGHCPYCQSNSVVAQQLQDELAKEKLDVQIVVLGDLNGDRFASKVSLPIFRDADGSGWEAMRRGASKHDTFVFGPDGKRTYFWLGSYTGDATRWRTEVGAAARSVASPAG